MKWWHNLHTEPTKDRSVYLAAYQEYCWLLIPFFLGCNEEKLSQKQVVKGELSVQP